MGSQHIVDMMRQTIVTALWMGAPLLILATVVGLVINVAQVLTSLQESTLSTVPRLFAVAAATIFLLPWMTHRLTAFTLRMFSDFRPFLQ
jgi:flagellar biosynthetic protein FliQ